MNKWLQNKYLWITILVIAAILRLYGLGLNPVGVSHDDEIQNLINAKSLSVVGTHAGNMVAGAFSTVPNCPGNCVYGELTSYILIPWMKFFPLDLFWSKLPFALASIFLVYFTGKLFENLSGKKEIGLLVGFAIAINPWAIHIGRMAYENTFSYLFYIVAVVLFTQPKFKKSNLVYGTLFAVAAFLFYFGTKPILPFVVLWGFLYNIIIKKRVYWKVYSAILIAFAIFLLIYFSALTHSFAGRRLNEVSLGQTSIESLVNQQRQNTLELPIIRNLAANKYIVKADILLEKLLGFFSPTFLYLKSTGSTDAYYISSHGYNYLIDLPLLIFGIMALASNFATALFLLSLLVLSVVPATLRTDSIYTFRSGLAYPLLAGLTGWGLYFLYQKTLKLQKLNTRLNKLPLPKIFLATALVLYSISLVYFLTIYWFRMPIQKSEGWYFHKRALTSYIQRAKKINNRITVVTSQPPDTYNTYVFFGGEYETQEGITKINKAYENSNYTHQNVSFTSDCGQIPKEIESGTTVFVEQGTNCKLERSTPLNIANPRDAGGLYKIYNDILCKEFLKNKYPWPRHISDFQVEKLTDEEFCTRWITDVNAQ